MEPDQPYNGASLVPNLADWRFEHYLTMRLLPLFYPLRQGRRSRVRNRCRLFLDIHPHRPDRPGGFTAATAGDCCGGACRTGIPDHGASHYAIIERMDALPEQVRDLSYRVDGITRQVDRLTDNVQDTTRT